MPQKRGLSRITAPLRDFAFEAKIKIGVATSDVLMYLQLLAVPVLQTNFYQVV
jgi:hypothetical protein